MQMHDRDVVLEKKVERTMSHEMIVDLATEITCDFIESLIPHSVLQLGLLSIQHQIFSSHSVTVCCIFNKVGTPCKHSMTDWNTSNYRVMRFE